MKLLSNAALTVLLVLAAGCQMPEKSVSQRNSEVDAWLIGSMQDMQIDNAVIREHTLYPYHFVINSADLNELGGRDLDVLAKHFKDNPGQINLWRGDVSGDLWQARSDTVLKHLAQAGVDMNRVRVEQGLPGGDGMTATEVVLRFKQAMEAKEGTKASSTDYTTMGMQPPVVEKP